MALIKSIPIRNSRSLHSYILQISDDEEDTHPNIDTPSLFKWRHEARVQRMEEFDKKKQEAEQEKAR